MILKIFPPKDLPQRKLLKSTNKYFFNKHFSILNKSIIAPQNENYIIQINKGVITIILENDNISKEKILQHIRNIFSGRQPTDYIEIE